MPTTVAIAASASGANEILPAVAGFKYRVLGFLLSFSGTVNAKWQSASTDLTGLFYGSATAGLAFSADIIYDRAGTPQGQFTTAGGEALNLNLSGAVATGGYLIYDKVPANL